MDSCADRDLMYFGPHGVPKPVLDCIQSSGWNINIAKSIDDAVKIINEKKIHVGLAAICSNNDNKHLLFIEELIHRTRRVEWVGLFPDANLKCQAVKKIIGDSFFDYHTMPHDPQYLLSSLGHAYGMAQMKWNEQEIQSYGEEEMVGVSSQIQSLFKAIRKVAGVSAPVLITGETGTGKELAAKAVHERSSFSEGPFVAVNCGAIPSTLVHSELFGYEKGAFTGAQKRKIGYIEAANGGTIFLDEIGDLPVDQQINLLRFLQEKTIQRVGGTEHIHLDVRVIAATHVDLEKAISSGQWREDLYYRLNVLQLKIPPLREREGDVELLAKYFFDMFSNEKNGNVKGFSQSCLNTMKYYAWKGNVREMINRIRRAVVMCDHAQISAADLDIDSADAGFQLISLKMAKDRAEQEIVRQTVARYSQNVTLAAQNLGISRVTLYRLLDKYDIRT
jgi:DNA-binding NtrC family response regulator